MTVTPLGFGLEGVGGGGGAVISTIWKAESASRPGPSLTSSAAANASQPLLQGPLPLVEMVSEMKANGNGTPTWGSPSPDQPLKPSPSRSRLGE